MSIYKIYDQATGKVVENGATANPIVVELNTERVNIKNILKEKKIFVKLLKGI